MIKPVEENSAMPTYWQESLKKDRHDTRDSLVEGLEGMKKDICEHTPNDTCDAECMYMDLNREYNQALQDAIDYITKELS